MAKTEIFITGVGGQGSLTASRLLGEAAMRAGLNVLVGEIHGMAQRGGVVESTVRIGDVHGPMIQDGQADVLLGFEPVETVRALGKAGAKTLVITNTRPIIPFSVSLKGENYPAIEGLLERIRGVTSRLIALDAAQLAQEVGNALAINSVLLGVLAGSGVLPFQAEHLLRVIEENVPPRQVEVNRQAFAVGQDRGRC